MKRKLPTLDEVHRTVAGQLPENSHLFKYQQQMAEATKKANKYHNVVVELDGMKFQSTKEYRRYLYLRALQTAGEITCLNCQTPFELSVCVYIADFTYKKDGKLVVEDVKSAYTRKLQPYRLKKKLMKAEKGIDILET